jgi:hypothetical protein
MTIITFLSFVGFVTFHLRSGNWSFTMPSFYLPKRKRPEDCPPALKLLQLLEKAQSRGLVSVHPRLSVVKFSFGYPKSNLYSGRRPKIKAVPKVKAKKGKVAVVNHRGHSADLTSACQALILLQLMPGPCFK